MHAAKRPFTLLEILLVIALVGITLGVITLQVPKALQAEAFERGVDQVKTKIALAQEVMLNYQTDVTVTLKSEREGMLCLIETEKPLTEKLKKNLNRHQLIKSIEEAAFDDQPAGEIILHFDGTLGAPPKGLLTLRGRNQEAVLTLKGFPSQLLRGDHVAEDSKAAYPEEILSFI